MGKETMEETIVHVLSSHEDLHMPNRKTFGADGEVHEEKMTHDQVCSSLRELLHKDPSLFLERHGKLLNDEHLAYFDSLEYNYELNWHLKTLRTQRNSSQAQVDKRHRITVRNRRLAYLDSEFIERDYFSMDNMRIRQPELYHQYVGKYHADPEDTLTPFKEDTKLSERIMLSCDLSRAEETIRRAQETREEVEEEDEDEDDEEETPIEDEEVVKPENEEADYEEFVSIMRDNFLEGKDSEFVDYSSIDNNVALDDYQQFERDEQEAYFDHDDDMSQ